MPLANAISAQFPALPFALPLGTAAVLAALNKFMPRRLADALAVFATLITFSIDAFLLHAVRTAPFVYWFGGWTPRSGIALGICFVIDPISCALAMLVSVLVLAAFIFFPALLRFYRHTLSRAYARLPWSNVGLLLQRRSVQPVCLLRTDERRRIRSVRL